jgi:formate hydrogenlyase subunit 6/NADH:ubiquinone oxidoreductase subunit I
MESENLYEELASHFDRFPIGTPKTPALMEILGILFPPEEAELALRMPIMGRTTVADLAGATPEAPDRLAAILDRMAEKGTVLKKQAPGKEAKYMLLPSEKGWCETVYWRGKETEHTRKLAPLWLRYRDEGYGEALARGGTPVMRVIPVLESVESASEVLPYEVLKTKVEEQTLIAVGHCPCRQIKRSAGQGCTHSLEACFSFGEMARYMLDYGFGREVSVAETLEIVKKCEAEGLVHSVENFDGKIGTLCNCCGCCCVFLDSRKRLGFHTISPSRYRSQVDAESCTACGVCEEMCQTEAIRVENGGAAVIDAERCIGCGLCVSCCPEDAVRLLPGQEITPPPAPVELFMRRTGMR